MTLEDALDELYKGQTNVAKQAAKLGLPTTELQQIFRKYAAAQKVDPEVWQGDTQVSWPYIT